MNGIRFCRMLSRVSVLGMLALMVLFAGCGQRGVAGEPSREPSLLCAPFDGKTAMKHRKAWADHLGVTEEITNSMGMRLTLIPAGEFWMGSPEGKVTSEFLHRVRITKPFYLCTYEVTQSEYKRVMVTNPSYFSPRGKYKDRVSAQDTDRFPVEAVSWQNAAEFCRKLSSRREERDAGRAYRLPTEAEWEYACRAGTTTPFHFGLQLNGREANGDGNRPYGTDEKGPCLERTTTVGSYQPNVFRLYDMHGNVLECCQDWYDGDYYRNSPLDDPEGPSSGASRRVIRGGSGGSSAWFCRSAYRVRLQPAAKYVYIGFRVASVPVDAPGE
jgi:formylglycine-generating enzyme required for sulfatase activity